MIEDGALGVIYGPPNGGKTFVALDWALSVATDRKWQGRRVRSGGVVYIVAEGGRNIGRRIKAWMIHNDVREVDRMFSVLRAIPFKNSGDVDDLVSQIRASRVSPRLIVIDTLARCFAGGDENSTEDMSEFVAACSRLQADTESAVVVVHHSGKSPAARERGSSALRGAADSMISVAQASKIISIKVDKQKDGELAKEVRLRLQTSVVDTDPRREGRSRPVSWFLPGECRRCRTFRSRPVQDRHCRHSSAFVAGPPNRASGGSRRRARRN